MEINNLNVQLLQSNLLNTTLNITDMSDHRRTQSIYTNGNTRNSFPRKEIGQEKYSNLKVIKSVIQLVNSSVQHFHGLGIHLEMLKCMITVNTHPPVSPMFVIENSTASITDCVFHGDSNAWAMNIKTYHNSIYLHCFYLAGPLGFMTDQRYDPKEISSVLFVFQYSKITIRKCIFDGIHVNITYLNVTSCIHALGSEIQIFKTTLRNNYGKSLIHMYKSDVTFLHSRFFNNTPYISGIIMSESDLSVNRTIFNGNTACYGVIFSDPNYLSSVEVKYRYFVKEKLKVANVSKVTADSIDFVNNTGFQAGAIFTKVSLLTVKNSNFTNNSQMGTFDCGAIKAENSIVTIDQTIFSNNYIRAVSAVNIRLRIRSATFINNRGGAFFVQGSDSKTSIEHTSFTNHTGAAAGRGYSGIMVIKNTTFNNNSGNTGGALSLTGLALYAQKVTFIGNRAALSGGAINVDYGKIIIHGSKFINNSATDTGGAIYAQQSAINDSTSKRNGTLEFEGVFSVIYSQDAWIKMERTSFTDNIALDRGGALYAENYEEENGLRNSHSNSIIINKTSFSGNGGLAGGAIYTEITGNITVNNSVFINNTVITGMHNVESRNGGAFYVAGICFANFSNVTFSGNKGMDKGGAIYAEQVAQVTLARALFTLNEVDNGAGIYAMDKTILKLENITFKQNKAYVSGGAIYAMGNINITMNNVSFNRNVAFHEGGAAYILDNAVVSLYKTSFKHNTINSHKRGTKHFSNGGALYAGGTSIVMLNQMLFYNNTCRGRGGAIYAQRNATITLQYVEFNENSAGKLEENYDLTKYSNKESCGGAIFGAGTLTIMSSNITFTRNTAYTGGGLCGVSKVKVIMANSTFTNNSAQKSGGALHIGEYTNIVINSATFTGNEAKSFGGDNCNPDPFRHPSDYYRGGGAIYAENNTSILVSHTTFNHNTAKDFYHCVSLQGLGSRHASGGAIYIHAQKSITLIINDTIFYGNTARTNGGAIFSTGNVTLQLAVVHFLNNSAEKSGAAMHVQESRDVFLYASIFVNNSAMMDSALYVWDIDTLHMANCMLDCMSNKPCILLSGHEEYLNYHTSLISGGTMLHSSSSDFMERAQEEGLIVTNSSYNITEKETIYASGRRTFISVMKLALKYKYSACKPTINYGS